MEIPVLHPGYFGPIDLFCHIAKAKTLLYEAEDHYQKQTFRNRQYIYTANGKLSLNIPVEHGGSKRYTDVEIDNKTPWQRTHWRSITTAYRTSPFFEFYEDELIDLYEKPYTSLYDFNMESQEFILNCLQLDISVEFTSEYSNYKNLEGFKDIRKLIVAKRKSALAPEAYDQVFMEKHGFISNLSILDLLFNKGPETLAYLRRQLI